MERRTGFGWAVVMGLSLSTMACARGGDVAKQPMGHIEVSHPDNPEDAPEQAKTIQVDYVFDRDVVNKDFDKTFKDKVEKKGVTVDETLVAHAHFDVKDARISGTVTYVKNGFGRYSIIEADLVASGHYDADVQVDVDVAMKGDSRKAKDALGDTLIGGKPVELVKNVMPTNIPIAGPLFLHTHFDLGAACSMDVEGQMHARTGVGIAGDVRLAAKYKKAGFPKEDGQKSKFAFEAKAPNFELAPKPYLEVTGGKQAVKGKCSLQPTAVLLLEHSVGAKIAVEPYVELSAQRPNARAKWTLDAQAGVSVNAMTDVEIFGRHLGKAKEFQLFDLALTKPGDELGEPPPRALPTEPDGPPRGKGGVQVASLLDGGLGAAGATEAKPVSTKKSGFPKLFGKKKK